jgi:hypothetical protein
MPSCFCWSVLIFLLFFGLVHFFYDLRFYCHFHDQIQLNKIKVSSTFVYLGSNMCFTIKLRFEFNSDLFTKCIAQDFVLVIAVKNNIHTRFTRSTDMYLNKKTECTYTLCTSIHDSLQFCTNRYRCHQHCFRKETVS